MMTVAIATRRALRSQTGNALPPRKAQKKRRASGTDQLAETGLAVLALGAVYEGGGLCVEAVEAVGVLVDEGVVLGDELPADLGGDDVIARDVVRGGGAGGGGGDGGRRGERLGHDGGAGGTACVGEWGVGVGEKCESRG